MIRIDIMQACRMAFSWKQTSTTLILVVGLILTTTMFSIGYGYSVFSIPFVNVEQLVTVGYPYTYMGQVIYGNDGSPYLDGISASLFFDLKERKDIFADMAAYKSRRQETYGKQGETTVWNIMAPKLNASFPGLDVTVNYFDVLGASFSGLREWKQSSETSYPVPLIVTYGTGMKNFGYDAIGKEFDSDSNKITLFGILPEGFLSLSSNRENCGFSPLILYRASADDVDVIARLTSGVTPQMAEKMLFGISNPSASDDPNASRIFVKSIKEQIIKPSQRIVFGAWLMGGFILILCIANISGIYLMRCNYQLREFGLKWSLGATFFQLIRVQLFELIILSGIALAIASMMVRNVISILMKMVPVTHMAFGKPASGWVIYIFMLACAITMVLISLTPGIIVVLKNYGRGFNRSHLTMFHRHKVTRMLLIVSQSAIAMLLLATSYMASRSYFDLFNKDVGVDSSVMVTTASYSWKIPDVKIGTIVNETLDALRGGNPDARVAAYQGKLFDNVFSVVNYRFNNIMFAQRIAVSPGFIRTVKGRLLAGREFNEKDRYGEVVLLNATLARSEGWSPQEAVGQIIKYGSNGQSAMVIGVIDDFLNNSWEDEKVEPVIFEPITMDSSVFGQVDYIVHPEVLHRAGSIEQTIYKSAPETVITRHTTWGNLLNSSASGKVLAFFIVVIFTVAAIVIVVTGIVNTVSFTVTRRTREIAVHIALGAPCSRAFWFVINDVVKSGVVGLLFGALTSWWTGKAVAHFFYNGLQYQDPLGLMFMVFVMLLIIIVASLIPAFRILRIEPSRAFVAE